MALIKYRSLVFVGLMTLFTFGLYLIYWSYKTKEEINSLGGKIPTFILFFIPFANIYFIYEYAHSYVNFILKKPEDTSLILLYTIVLLFFPFITMFFIQSELNKLVRQA